jgi:sugar phosphate isomerase/epimerase
MKIGLSTATFFGKILTENSFEYIKSFGIDTAEVFLTTFSEYEESFTDLLKDRASGIEVYSVHSLNNHYEPELSRLKVTEYNLDYKRIGERAEELCHLAEGYGVKIAYENVSWAFYNRPGFFTKMLRYAPSLTGCLDIKQAMQAFRNQQGISAGRALTDGEYESLMDYTLSYIDDMGDRLVNVHLSDYHVTGKLCPPGQGIFDFSKLIFKLKKSGYSGPLIIELYSGDYENFDEIKESIKYLKDIQGGEDEGSENKT